MHGAGGVGNVTTTTMRDEELLLYQRPRGLGGLRQCDLDNMRRNLQPEGTRIHDNGSLRRLPRGTKREMKEGMYERVIIPPPILDRTNQPERINLDDVLGSDTDERMAFEGSSSLNPMQSAVFDAAYNTRENLLICAPTGEFDGGGKGGRIYVVIVYCFLISPCWCVIVWYAPFLQLTHSISHLLAASLDNENKARARRMSRCLQSSRTCTTLASSVAAIVTTMSTMTAIPTASALEGRSCTSPP